MVFSQVRGGGVRRLHPVRPPMPHLRLHQEEEIRSVEAASRHRDHFVDHVRCERHTAVLCSVILSGFCCFKLVIV